MKKILILTVIVSKLLFAENIIIKSFPSEARILKVGDTAILKDNNKIVKYLITYKSDTEICIKSLTKNIEFENYCFTLK